MSMAERKAAIAAAAAAAHAATCPWGKGDAPCSETGSQASSRQPSSRVSTCPWGQDEVQSSRSKKSAAPAPRPTCPWGSSTNDADSVRLAEAARKRDRGKPQHFGAAGSGAPKLPVKEEPILSMGPMSMGQNAPPVRQNAPPMREEPTYTEPAQRMAPCPAADEDQYAGGATGDEDDDLEQRELIQHCLNEGLSEDRIMEMLEDYQNHKLLQRTRDNLPPRRAPPAQPEALGPASGVSVAASREAKSKKSLSFGPTDEEIVDVLHDYAKENLTPPESPGNLLTLAAKRQKDKQASDASVGSFDTDKSRLAYEQSKKQMDAVKNKNRQSSGIF